MEPILSFMGENRWLSNFAASDVSYEGEIYPTVEHAYQAAKTLDLKQRKEIQELATPKEARQKGQTVTLRYGWESIKLSIMKELVKQKFQQPYFRDLLLATGNAYLKEGNYWHDNFFGSCTCDKPKCRNTGKNNLGLLIMAIRDNKESKEKNKDHMEIIYSTDQLESVSSKKLRKFWQGHVAQDGDKFYTQTSYFQELKDGSMGKVTYSVPTLVVGKNIGRANETTDKEQAFSELKTLTNKQIDKGYHKEGEESKIHPLPMKCMMFENCKHRLKGKLIVQPKYNGTRKVYDGKVMWSNGGKDTDPKIFYHLRMETHGHIVDGELILPTPRYTFQQTLSATARFQLNLTPKLEFVIFDIMDLTGELTFLERYEIAKQLVEEANNPKIKLAPIYYVKDLDEVMEYQEKFVAEGFEGIIIRTVNGLYKTFNTGRSHEIQKYKYFFDAEFEVVDIVGGRGKEEELATFVCKSANGSLFNASFNGTDELRREMYNNPEEYIGKLLTVKFQAYNDDGVTPQFGKGIYFKDFDIE